MSSIAYYLFKRLVRIFQNVINCDLFYYNDMYSGSYMSYIYIYIYIYIHKYIEYKQFIKIINLIILVDLKKNLPTLIVLFNIHT